MTDTDKNRDDKPKYNGPKIPYHLALLKTLKLKKLDKAKNGLSKLTKELDIDAIIWKNCEVACATIIGPLTQNDKKKIELMGWSIVSTDFDLDEAAERYTT